MQEFRPADVIEQDTRLAESLIAGDLDALEALVIRYGRAVETVVAQADDVRPNRSVDVFAQAWIDRHDIDEALDFAPWIGGLAARAIGRGSIDVEAPWAVAMAIDAVADDVRPGLRAHHVDGDELDDGIDRHELRLRRRLAHLGAEATVASALADPMPWSDPPGDLIERVHARLGLELGAGDPGGGGGSVGDPDAAVPSRVERSLRPVLLGLAGAAAVIFVAVIALSAASGSPDPIAFTADLTPTGAILDVEGGELTVTERNAGLQIDLDAPTLPRRAGDQFYEGVLVLRDGSELSAGTFNEGLDVTLTAGVDLDRVETFLVVTRGLGSDVRDAVLKLDVPRT